MDSIICGAGIKIYYSINDARSVYFYTNSTCNITTEIESNKKIIKSIECGNLILKKDFEFKHNYPQIPSSYKILDIQNNTDNKKYKNSFIIFSDFKNFTTRYILPCLGNNNTYFLTESNLINCYIDKNKEYLYLLYRYSQTEQYSDYLEPNIHKHSLYIGRESTFPGFDTFKFKIPDEHSKDIKLFLKGKYSKLSENLKNKITYFYKLGKKDYIYQVINKEEKLQHKLEVFFGCDMNNVELENKPKEEDELWFYSN